MRLRLMSLFAFGIALVAVACSSADPDPTATPTATSIPDPTATPTAPANRATEAEVRLIEWDVELDSTVLTSGRYDFDVQNTGTALHELVIIKTDTAIGDLPTVSGEVDEDAAGEVVARVDNLASGASGSAEVDLEAGNYVFTCNIPGHFALGMATEVTVN